MEALRTDATVVDELTSVTGQQPYRNQSKVS